MTELKNRDFVIPGEVIMNSMDYLPGKNCFREGDAIIAKRLGIVSIENRVISIIPLSGGYIPKPGDMVIGEVVDIQSNGWVMNIDSSLSTYLPLSGVREYIDTTKTSLSRFYSVGDILYAKVSVVNSIDSIHISMQDTRARKLRGGRIVHINPAKVPRLIGREGSMISMIKERSGCRISVGQNGLVWIEGGNEDLAIKAIEFIDKEAHIEGLTDKIAEMLGHTVHAKEIKEEKDWESNQDETYKG